MSDDAVLFVDDDENILHSLKRLLRKEPYGLVTASSGNEGLQCLAERPIQVVLSDERMPGMSGIEFLQRVKEDYPQTVRVVLSGYADVGVVVESINKGAVYRFLAKPWNDDELKAVIRQCFEHYHILRENRDLLVRTREQNEQLRHMNERLESLVKERTRSLQMAQDIMERLPAPVLGIGCENEVIFVNEAARQKLPGLEAFLPGCPAAELLPAPLAEAVQAAMQSEEIPEPLTFGWHGLNLRVHIRHLFAGKSDRGVIVMMCPYCIGD